MERADRGDRAVSIGLPDGAVVEGALSRILASPQFANAPRACRFLRFVVESTLAGRGNSLKEYVLGVEVFDRAASFDPRIDTIVRVEAVKLRNRLQIYYRCSGRKDPVVIELPKGAYLPHFRLRVKPKDTTGSSRSRPLSIAVLPFVNLTPGTENEFWSDGLTDELTSILARAASLCVISRTSALAFKGKALDVRAIGRRLGASLVVEGSIRKREDLVRVAAQLTDVGTGAHLWSITIEREIEDAWAVQQEIATALVTAIHVKLTPRDRKRMGKPSTESAEAFKLCLKARHQLERFDVRSQREALNLFHQACAADPEYALPLLGIARGQMNLAVLGVAPPSEIVPRAKAALRQALTLDPEIADAHALLASVVSRHEWNWPEAERHYRLALRLAPHAAEVHDEYASSYLAPLGRIEEALAENRLARELDPFSPQLMRSYVFILLLTRRLADAERECRRILKDRPEDGYVRLILALALHGQKGRIKEALAEYEGVYAGDPSLQHEVYVANVRALCGEPGPAEELLQRLAARAQTEFVPAMLFAWLHLHLRRIDQAVVAIEEAYRNREYELLLAKVGYGFDSFREDARFRAILSKLGLE